MSTLELSVADDDRDDYGKLSLDTLARAANHGIGQGETDIHDASGYTRIGQVVLRRAQVAPPTTPRGENYLG